MGQWTVKAASDTTGPVFKSISVSGSAFAYDTVKVSVDATDDISGVNYAELWYVSQTGLTQKHIVLKPDILTGKLQGSTTINYYSEKYLWRVDRIDIYDNAGNKSTVHNSETNTFGNLVDLSAADLMVNGTYPEDIPPTFQGFSIDKNSASPGTEVNVTVNAIDGISGINYAYIQYSSPSGATYKYAYLYPYPGDYDKLKAAPISIGQYDESGEWIVDYIEVCDNSGNIIDIFNSELYNDPTLPLQNLSAGDFTVTGTSTDNQNPSFQSISLEKSRIQSGKFVNITIKASDTQSGVDYGYLMYSTSSGALTYALLEPDSNGDLKTSLSTTSLSLGKWTVEGIGIIDKAGNYIDIYNTETTSDPSLNLMDLSAGDFTIYVNQDQPYPTGLTAIGTTTHGGTDGKIVGTSNLMEYQLSGMSSYIPVTGTEITGLTAGNYYVRYAAREEYNAGPETLVQVTGPEFDVYQGVLLKYNGTGGDVVIPDNLGITSIGFNAFYANNKVTSVTIPSGITSIGTSAFAYCSNLKSVVIPESVNEISGRVFEYCSSLDNVTLPSGITTINNLLFNNCRNLVSITIPSGVTNIGSSAFNGCNSLTGVNIPNTVTSIGDSAFANCIKLNNVILPNGIKTINSSTFSNCNSLASIVIPEGVTSISYQAFAYSGLKSIVLPNTVTLLDSSIFYNSNSLASVTLPEGMKKITASMFSGCSSLTSIKIPDSVEVIDSSSFSGCSNLSSITMPSSLKTIGPWAFQYCSKLTAIDLPSSLKEIGLSAFNSCSSLNTINAFPLAAPTIGSYVFDKIPLGAVINIVPGASGYNVSPWSNYTQKTMAAASIEVTTAPLKTNYYTGQSLKLTGIVVKADYGDSNQVQVPVTASNISGFDSSVPAAGQKVTVTVNGKTATFDVNIIDKSTAPPSTGNMAKGKLITSSSALTDAAYATDGSAGTDKYANITNSGLQWVQVDLGATKSINEINLWHYFGSARAYKDVIVQISEDPTFATGVKTVYNNDRDNSAKLGAGTDYEYTETSAGLNVAFNTTKGRYVRFYSNGSNINGYNHYVELEIYGELPVVPAESVSLDKASAQVETGVTYTLGAIVSPSDATNKNVTWSSSDDSIATVSTAGVVTGVKPGTVSITATTVDGSKTASCEMTVTLAASKLSTGKAITNSSAFTNAAWANDGYKGTDKYANSVGSGLQYIQMDLGAYYDLTKINLWHYFGDARTYKDVVVQVSNDPAFATDVTTVFNNDTNNSAGLGTGKDAEYAETSAGKTIPFDKVNARYVRIYSNGSYVNGWNHYVEVEVYGFDGPVVSATSVSLNKTSDTIMAGGSASLAAKFMPLNTTNQNVTWSSSNESVATVNANGVYTAVAPGTATITATTADGGFTADCEVTVTEAVGNLAKGKTMTSSTGFTNLALANDGSTSTDFYANGTAAGLQWVQVDLGASFEVNHFNLWHYYGGSRTYKDVIVQLSDDPEFKTYTTVFNNDTNNSAGKGTGTDSEYVETSAGLSVDFTATKARYARFYSNGSSINGYNHYVEIEISKEIPKINYSQGKTVTTSGAFGNVAYATDKSVNTDQYANGAGTGLQWIQVDLGAEQDINEVNLWHYFGSARTYKDVIVQISSDPEFKTYTSVFNNDTNNSAGFGAGKDAEYAETAAGKCITFNTVKGRYVRFYSNGSNINGYNHYVEVEVCKNLSTWKAPKTSGLFIDSDFTTDGNRNTYSDGAAGLQWIQYDLLEAKLINEINLWHFAGRTYKDVIVMVSNDPEFKTYSIVYNNDANNSAGFGAGKDAEYLETSAGKKISFSTVNAQYVRFYSNGSNVNGFNHYSEVEICNNFAAGKPVTATSPAFAGMNYLNDGDKNVDKYANGLAPGLQWVQIDLGDTKSVSEINLWHYFGGSRQYHDVVVQLSDDPTFKTYTTVYNNDTNNSAGFGAGKDSEYVETSLGKKIKFNAINARYVRFYSNGSNINGYNHYVEAEVLGN
jgi:uncharacterized protein YjdB